MIKKCSGNVKSGAGRPEEIRIGDTVTILNGRHGSGKTRCTQLLEFAVSGEVRQIAFREGARKSGTDLIRLAPAGADRLWASVQSSSEGSFTREMKIDRDETTGKITVGKPRTKPTTPPYWVPSLPLPGVYAALTRNSEEARKDFLSRAIPVGTGQGITLTEGTKKVLATCGILFSGELGGLSTLQVQVTTVLEAMTKGQKTNKEWLEGQKEGLPRKPEARRLAYEKAILSVIKVLQASEEETKKLEEAKGRVANAKANLDTLAPKPEEVGVLTPPVAAAPAPVVQAPSGGSPLAAIVERMDKTLSLQGFILMNPGSNCMVCGHETTPAGVVGQMQTVAQGRSALVASIRSIQVTTSPVPPVQGPSQEEVAYRVARDKRDTAIRIRTLAEAALQAAEVEVTRLEASVTFLGEQFKAAQNETQVALKALGTDVSTVLDEDPRAHFMSLRDHNARIQLGIKFQESIDSAVKASGAWTLYDNMQADVVTTGETITLLVAATKEVGDLVDTHVQGNIKRYLETMREWFPKSLGVPCIRLTDVRGNPTFDLYVQDENETEGYEPSGVQAFALAVAYWLAGRRLGESALLIAPDENHIDQQRTVEFAQLYSKLPEGVQIVFSTTEDVPARVYTIPGVVVIDLDGRGREDSSDPDSPESMDLMGTPPW